MKRRNREEKGKEKDWMRVKKMEKKKKKKTLYRCCCLPAVGKGWIAKK
jgi:hypothetical protein